MEVLKINSSHYNHKISPSPVGYVGQMYLFFAQIQLEAVVWPAQEEGPPILFSILQRVKNLDIKKKTRGILNKNTQTSWKIKYRPYGL